MAGGASGMRTTTIKRTLTQGPGKHENVEQVPGDGHVNLVSESVVAAMSMGRISVRLRVQIKQVAPF
jgi:hypothetical protein